MHTRLSLWLVLLGMGSRRHPRAAKYWQQAALEVCLVCAIFAGWCAIARAQQNGEEYQAEAAYLYNFAKMARWRVESLPEHGGLILGVLGGNEDFVTVLRDVLAGKEINGHAIEVRYLRSPEEVKFCHLVFFRVPERTSRSVIAQLGKSSVLLVGENKKFLNDGGMINLVPAGGKITYHVNAAALAGAGIHYGESNLATTSSGPAVPDIQPESSRSIAFRLEPEYPRIATSLKLAGVVQLQAVVRADGTVRQVRVIGGHPVLAEAAAAAVMRWRYEAGPRETTESVKVSFAE